MALWRVVFESDGGVCETQLLAAGNRAAALERAGRFAAARGIRLVEGPDVVDPVKGTL
ncbi:MAG TPA: hypothetical protein VI997_11740 [Candidatus Thermoplasmatota archaeon]|nr:hypothetical protein [Candidatus Thermoplasmatota archaeon]